MPNGLPIPADDPAAFEDSPRPDDPDKRPDDPAGWYPAWDGPDAWEVSRPCHCYACGRADARTLCGGLLCHDCLEASPDGLTLEFLGGDTCKLS